MHIKKLKIDGYRTYKDSVEVEFAPGYNCVVGGNGSGKSNILGAISFVLGEGGGGSVFHSGASLAVQKASVQLLLDNKDRSFGLYKQDEVTLSRTLIQDKDTYMINSRKMSRTAYIDTLEAAGFSQTNSYHIVKQGKVTQIAQMSDKARYALLQLIAGAKLYDEKKKTSLKDMEERERELRSADEALRSIGSRLEEVARQQEDLKVIQQLEHDKNCIEYCVNSKHWHRSNNVELKALEQIKICKLGVRSIGDEIETAEEKEAQKNLLLQQNEKRLAFVQAELTALKQQKSTVKSELLKCQAHKLEVKRQNENIKKLRLKEEEKKKQIQIECEALQKQLDEELMPQHKTLKHKLNQVSKSLSLAENQAQQIYGRRSEGRRSLADLRGEVEESTQMGEQLNRAMAGLEREIGILESKEESLVVEEGEVDSSCEKLPGLIEKAEKGIKRETEEANRIIEERRLVQKKRYECVQRRSEMCDQEKVLLQRFYGSMRKNLKKGIEHADKWAQVTGQVIPGILLKNIEIIPEVRLAAENVAKMQLLNYVVHTKQQMFELAAYIRTHKAGELTVVAIEEAQNRNAKMNYPKSKDVQPISEYIKCTPKINPVVNQIFGKTLLCDDMDSANRLRKEGFEQFEYVNVEGDILSQNRTLSGGFTKMNKLKSQLFANWKKVKEEIDHTTVEETCIRTTESELEEKYKASQEKELLSRKKHQKLCLQQTDMHQKKRNIHKELKLVRDKIYDISNSKLKYTTDLEVLQAKIAELQKEIKNPPPKDQTANLKTLEKEIKKLTTQEDTASSEFYTLNEKVVFLKNKLHQNLFPQLENIQNQISQSLVLCDQDQEELILHNRVEDLDLQIDSLLAQRRRILKFDFQEGVVDCSEGMEEGDEGRNTCVNRGKNVNKGKNQNKGEKNAEKKKDKIRETEDDWGEDVTAIVAYEAREEISSLKHMLLVEQKKMQHFENVLTQCQKEKDMYNSKRLNLQQMDERTLDRYSDMCEKSLEDELLCINNKLQQYPNINRKSVDQLFSLSSSYAVLNKRREEIAKSQIAVMELMEVMDGQKTVIVDKAFKNINHNFKKVFSSLVPNSFAQLVQTNLAPPEAPPEFGISIKASFANNQVKTLSQLSGGQKTLLSLSLIFAIQIADPAPFYLFDEIEAALDDQHRVALANEISRQTEGGIQIVLTTFKKELVRPADLCLQVTIRNRCSNVLPLHNSDAVSFVQDQLNQS